MGNILAVTLGSRLSLEQEVSALKPLESAHWLVTCNECCAGLFSLWGQGLRGLKNWRGHQFWEVEKGGKGKGELLAFGILSLHRPGELLSG